ncbi:flagellar biosynthesis protein FlhF [Peptococcaceae bacterium 1198_IL3148]
MIIKKFVVDEMPQAVQQIKAELGPEAIIVSSKKVRGQGIKGLFKTRIEVTAVLDEVKELQAPPQYQQLEKPKEPVDQAVAAVHPQRTVSKVENLTIYQAADLVRTTPTPTVKGPKPVMTSANKLQSTEFKPILEETVMKSLEPQEKGRLLAMLEQQAGQKDLALDKDFNCRWLEILTDMDIDQGIAKKLLHGLEQAIKDSSGDKNDLAKVHIINKVTDLLKPAYENIEPAKFMFFVGQPGVGKTTTLAKLATRFKLLDNKQVALITVYTYRYGAADQLKIYGDTIDVPVEVVMTPAELKQAVERHAEKDYILIDTVGRSSKNTGQVLELKGFIEAVSGSKQIYLVSSASTKDRDLFRTIRDFKIAHYNGYIFTKVDETETLGSMLNVVLKTGIPIQYYCDGQSIPDDIEEVQPRKLAQLLFRSVDQYVEGYNNQGRY